MPVSRIRSFLQKAREMVRANFKTITLDFLFIFLFVNLFQMVFGAENSIVGVILTILMPSSMVRDLTGAPVRNFFRISVILFSMTLSAFLVTTLNPLLALPVNFLMLLVILYLFTFEYSTHLYVPYILSYLFLVFISPVSSEQLPKRLVSVLAGAVCILLYQLVKGRKRAQESAQDALGAMIGEAQGCVRCLLTGKDRPDDPETVRANLCALSKLIYDRRKSALHISDAAFSMLDAGRGLENLILALYRWEGPTTPAREALLNLVAGQLEAFRAFLCREADSLPPLPQSEGLAGQDEEAGELLRQLRYIREHLQHMADPERKASYRKTFLSFSVRVRAALDVSPVRVVYALRVAALLSVFTLIVQLLGLPHGKWLLFTLASVSLPYADDVGTKAKKRLTATVIGGIPAFLFFALIPSMAARTAFMIFTGYLTSYFTDYRFSFACSTVGGLGGAMLAGSFGWGGAGEILLIRLGYICAGVLIAWAVNCLLFPFRRKTASQQLWDKYASTTELLGRICREENADPQIYYSLVIQSHLMEEKLKENAVSANWEGMSELLEPYRARVRSAHRGIVREI